MPRHPSGPLIPQGFYLRPAAEVAADLLGRHLVRDGVVLAITEVEAYGGPEDSASHCRFGRTARNAPMWEAGGRAYVYRCYGVHWMLNLVTGEAEEGAAVLVRACRLESGIDEVLARRGKGRPGPGLLAGPGKVAQALGLDGDFNHHLLFQKGGLEVREGHPEAGGRPGPRVGIGFARPGDRDAPLRFAVGDPRWVSRPLPPP